MHSPCDGTEERGNSQILHGFSRFNSVTITDAHPLPQVDASLDQLSGSRFLTCLNLSWLLASGAESRWSRKDCVFFWKRIVVFMGMGLKNAPPTFQFLMELALNGFDRQYVLVYIDDICLFSPTFEHHLVLLRDVLTKLCVANL